MNVDRLKRMEAIFDRVIDLPDRERVAALDRECRSDAELRAMVERLIQRAGAPTAIEEFRDLHSEPTNASAPSVPADELGHPGDVIGRYKLLEQIGEGGFGVVYLAEQVEPVRRRVAFKIIKLGMDTKQVIARFEAERQALALMDHPHIARVLDAGATATGRPYFVMEFVRGRPITEFCDAHDLSVRQRLDLFKQVCHAIQHAHQKGIIHRDLKPSNILVAMHDDKPLPKVIDFGIAKATNARLTEKTLFTQFRQMIGTPQYMSPEQAGASADDIDTRSDIYSLGVLLYELLTGAAPLDEERLKSAAYGEIQRIIREEEPVKPSTRVSTLHQSRDHQSRDRQGAVSHPQPSHSKVLRHARDPDLARTLRGDLDWIVMKSLEKDRARRYETALELARDIDRHLSDEPVSAGPPGAVYRFRKFARRNRGLMGAVSATAAALFIGLGLAIMGFIRASDERNRALDAEAKMSAALDETTAVRDFLVKMLEAPDEFSLGRDARVRDVLDQAAATVGEEFRDRPLIEAETRAVIGATYTHLGLYDKAAEHLPRALEIRRRELGDDDPRTLALMRNTAMLYSNMGRLAKARELLEIALERYEALHPAEDQRALSAREMLAKVLREQGDLDAAETLYLELLELQGRVLGECHETTLGTLSNLGKLYLVQSRPDKAIATWQEALGGMREHLGPDHPFTQITTLHLANALFTHRSPAEAIPLYEEALRGFIQTRGEEDQWVLFIRQQLAGALARESRFQEAAALYAQIILALRARAENGTEDDIAQLGSALYSYGKSLTHLDRYKEAEAALLEAHDIVIPRAAGAHAITRDIELLYRRWGKLDKADEWKRPREQSRASEK